MNQAMIQAIIDAEPADFDALEVALVEAAHDVLMASKLFREHPKTAAKLLRGAANRQQQAARTVEIARRTGQRMSANREQLDAYCEH